ncbi:MAG: hypothetical protein DRI54_04350 [Bacteroidetes bacterium]|nr:MAG: hypothetical protein DRI54_04350 [Bacteroidota bacterium]
MKKIVLFTVALAFIVSTGVAVTSFMNTELISLNSSNTVELVNDQGEKTKSKDDKKESAGETTEKKSTSSSKKSCKESCKKSCDDKKSSKSKN